LKSNEEKSIEKIIETKSSTKAKPAKNQKDSF